MRRRVALILAALAVAILPGCLEWKDELALEADGSGTYTVTMVTDLVKTAEMKQMIEMLAGGMGGANGGGMAGGLPQFEMPNLDDPAAVEKAIEDLEAIEGIEVLSTTPIRLPVDGEKKTHVGGTVSLRFKSLAALAKVSFFRGQTISLQQAADGTWSFATERVPAEAAEALAGTEAQQIMPMVEGMLGPIMQGLKVESVWRMPGTTTTTTGTAAEDGAASWRSGFKDVLAKPKSLNRSVSFKGEALKLTPFELKDHTASRALRGVGIGGGAPPPEADEPEKGGVAPQPESVEPEEGTTPPQSEPAPPAGQDMGR